MLTEVSFGGNPIETSMSKAQIKHARNRYNEACKRRKQLVAALSKKPFKVDDAQLKGLAEEFLTNNEVRFASAIEVNSGLDEDKRHSLEASIAISDSLDLRSPIPEVVRAYPKKKHSGGFRPICIFGLRHRTAQDVVRLFVSCLFAPRAFQFENKGVSPAIKRALQALDEGYVYVAHADIARFFPSFDGNTLGSVLPWPKGVMEAVVLGKDLKVRLDKARVYKHGSHVLDSPTAKSHFLMEARSGIPQGSACSSIVASYCVSRMAWPIMPGIVLVNYVDNFLLLAKSAKLLAKGREQLIASVESLPSGHFKLKPVYSGPAKYGFDFLGHCLSWGNAGVRISPHPAAIASLEGKLYNLEKALQELLPPESWKKKHQKPNEVPSALVKMVAIVNGWAQAFRLCEDVDEFAKPAIEEIGKWCDLLEFDLVEVKKKAKQYGELSFDVWDWSEH
jgi:hypothetical protein